MIGKTPFAKQHVRSSSRITTLIPGPVVSRAPFIVYDNMRACRDESGVDKSAVKHAATLME